MKYLVENICDSIQQLESNLNRVTSKSPVQDVRQKSSITNIFQLEE